MAVFLNVNDPDFETAFATLLGAKREDSPDVQNVVAEIISEVRAGGDEAVLRLTKKFDRIALTVDQMRFSQDQIARYCAEVSLEERAALELAAERIRTYHQKQLPEDAQWTDPSGAELGWRWTPVSGRWSLRAWWFGQLSVFSADECYSCKSGGR